MTTNKLIDNDLNDGASDDMAVDQTQENDSTTRTATGASAAASAKKSVKSRAKSNGNGSNGKARTTKTALDNETITTETAAQVMEAEAEAEAAADQSAVVDELNLALWHQVEKTDPAFTKPFHRTGGFKGTAVNATYLARTATQVFGAMGIGWGLEILDEDLMEGAPLDDQGTRELIHKVRVKLWYRQDGERGEVVQFGLTTFVGRNRFGIFTDEEAPKKSLTDAMSKCLSLLGFAADVYLGQFDDSKYVAEVSAEFEKKRRDEQRRRQPAISGEQLDDLQNLLGQTGTDEERFCEFFRIDTLADLPAQVYERATQMLKKKIAVAA